MRISNLQFSKGSIVFSDNSSHYLPTELVKRPLLVIGNYTHIMSKIVVCSITSRNQPGIRIKLWNYATNSQMIANDYGISTIQPYAIYSISTASITSTIGVLDPFIMKQVEKDVQFFLGFSDEIPEYLKNRTDLYNIEYNYGDESKDFGIGTDEVINPKYTKHFSSFLNHKTYPTLQSITENEDTVAKIVLPSEVEPIEAVPEDSQYEEFSFHIGRNIPKEEQDLLIYINNFLVIVKDRSIYIDDLYNSYCLSGLKNYYKSKVKFTSVIKRILESAKICIIKTGGSFKFKGVDFKKNVVQTEPVVSNTKISYTKSDVTPKNNTQHTHQIFSVAAPCNEQFDIVKLMKFIHDVPTWSSNSVNSKNKLAFEDNALILLDKCTIEEISTKINQSSVSSVRLRKRIFENALERAIKVITNEIYMDDPMQIPIYDLICTMVVYATDYEFFTKQIIPEYRIGLFTLLTQTKNQLNYTAPIRKTSTMRKLIENYQEPHDSTNAPVI